jgi:hypothetical protein
VRSQLERQDPFQLRPELVERLEIAGSEASARRPRLEQGIPHELPHGLGGLREPLAEDARRGEQLIARKSGVEKPLVGADELEVLVGEGLLTAGWVRPAERLEDGPRSCRRDAGLAGECGERVSPRPAQGSLDRERGETIVIGNIAVEPRCLDLLDELAPFVDAP